MPNTAYFPAGNGIRMLKIIFGSLPIDAEQDNWNRWEVVSHDGLPDGALKRWDLVRRVLCSRRQADIEHVVITFTEDLSFHQAPSTGVRQLLSRRNDGTDDDLLHVSKKASANWSLK